MIRLTQNAHERIIKVLTRLYVTHPFFSYILMHFKITATEDNTMPTVSINKRGDFFYNENFIESLTQNEIEGVLIHEAMHIAKYDFIRQGSRNDLVWNIASDAIINFMLIQEGFTLPQDGINPNHRGELKIGDKIYNVNDKITEVFYEELLNDIDEIPRPEYGHGGFDIHISNSNTDQKLDSNADQESDSTIENKWKKIIIEAATNTRLRGKTLGCVESVIDKILNPVIDWRTRIQRFVTNEIPVDYTNRFPSRKFYGTGVWAPKILRENVEVFIGVDVSGSTEQDRKYFISEVVGILSAYEQVKARIIFWDYNVNPNNDLEITSNNKNSIIDFKIKDSNGGTRLSSYAEYCIKKDYRCRLHIILTDGYVENNPKVPSGNIIFVLSKNGDDKMIKKYGAVARLTDIEQ